MKKLSFIHNYESELNRLPNKNNCKTLSLGGSFTMHDPNLWVQLLARHAVSSTQNSVGLGTLKYCPPTMVCCLKFEIHVTIGNPCKVKPTLLSVTDR